MRIRKILCIAVCGTAFINGSCFSASGIRGINDDVCTGLDYRIINQENRRALNFNADDDSVTAAADDGANPTHRTFTLVHHEGSFYKIIGRDGKALNFFNAHKSGYDRVTAPIDDGAHSTHRAFTLVPVGGSFYKIKNQQNGRVLNFFNANKPDYDRVTATKDDDTYGTHRAFRFELVSGYSLSAEITDFRFDDSSDEIQRRKESEKREEVVAEKLSETTQDGDKFTALFHPGSYPWKQTMSLNFPREEIEKFSPKFSLSITARASFFREVSPSLAIDDYTSPSVPTASFLQGKHEVHNDEVRFDQSMLHEGEKGQTIKGSYIVHTAYLELPFDCTVKIAAQAQSYGVRVNVTDEAALRYLCRRESTFGITGFRDGYLIGTLRGRALCGVVLDSMIRTGPIG